MLGEIMAAVRPPLRPSLVAYYRVSTREQGRSGLGIDAQRAAVSRFGEAEGFEVVAEFVEIETGTAPTRSTAAQLAAALAGARRNGKLRARLSQPGAIRGSTRPADGQNRGLILSTCKGALQPCTNQCLILVPRIIGPRSMV
jgi:hypothetical protein